MPLVLRSVPHDLDPSGCLTDGVSPYGYASPLINAPSSDVAVELALPVFAQLGAAPTLQNHIHAGEETLPLAQLDAATEWFDQWL